MEDGADTAVQHVHRSLLPRIDLSQLQSRTLQVNVPPRLTGASKPAALQLTLQQAEDAVKTDASAQKSPGSEHGSPKYTADSKGPRSKSPAAKEAGSLQPAFKAGFPYGRAVTPRDVAVRRKQQLQDAKAYYSTNNYFSNKAAAEKAQEARAAEAAQAAASAAARDLPESDVLGVTLDGSLAAAGPQPRPELLKSNSIKTAVITSRVLPAEQSEAADKLFSKFVDESMRVAPASNQPQQQQQQQPAAPAVPALGLKSIRGGTMAGKSMGGASARGSVPGMGTWSARSAAGTLSGGQGGSSSGGGYGGAAAEAEEDEESSLAAMLTVLPSAEPAACRTAKHQFAPTQAPEGKPVSLAITPDKQLLQQALERAAIAAATTAAAVGGPALAGTTTTSSSSVPQDMWPPAAGLVAGDVASRRVTGTPSEGTRSHRVTGSSAGRTRRRSSTAGMSTAGGRSPGAALLALVSTQVSPIRQRLLAEAGVQRAKRGTDLLRNSWPLTHQPFPSGAEPLSTIKALSGAPPAAYPLEPPPGPTTNYYAGQEQRRGGTGAAEAGRRARDGRGGGVGAHACTSRSDAFGSGSGAGSAAEGGARAMKRRNSNVSSSNWAADAAMAAAAPAEGLPLPGEGDLEGLLGEDGVMYPSAQDVHTLVSRLPPAVEDVGPAYAWGAVGRLQRRYDSQAAFDPTVFDLSYALSGRREVGPLVAALPRWPQLQHLRLRNNGWDDWAVQELVKALLQPAGKNVVGLDLAYNCLSPDSATLLAPLLHDPPLPSVTLTLDKALAPHALLTHLVLAGNPIGDAGAEVLLKLVGSGDCPLKLLDVSRCEITAKCAATLKQVLEGARQLTVLRLGWNRLGPRGARALAEGLRYSSTLKQLHLPWSGITDDGASHIAAAMESNSSVKLLDLSGCQVSAATCLVLVETLSSNKVLEQLVLQENPLGRAGAQRLLRAVHAGELKSVDIAGCGFLPTLSALTGSPAANSTSSAAAGGSGAAGAAAGNSSGAAASGSAGGKKGAGGKGGEGGNLDATPRALGVGFEGFNPRDANGVYSLNMAMPGEYQVAVELYKLAQEYGVDTWKVATLDGKPFSIKGMTRQQLPRQGQLKLEFFSDHKQDKTAVALTDDEFDSMWVAMVDARRLEAAAEALQGDDDCDGLPATRVHGQPLPRAGRHGLGAGGSMPGWAARGQVQLAKFDRPGSGESGHSMGSEDAPSYGWAQQEQRCSSGGSSGSSVRPGSSRLAAATGWAPKQRPEGTFAGGLTAFDQSKVGRSVLGDAGPGSGHVHWVTDDWKRGLLAVLVDDCYFTSRQAAFMVSAFNYGGDKVDAAVKVFGRCVDPENFAAEVYPCLNAWQAQACDERLGVLRLFSPLNPTGAYDLLLSHPAHYLVAVRLVELFQQQYIDGLCDYPHHVSFAAATLNGCPLPAEVIKDPLRIKLPREGLLKVAFVDLRCLPEAAAPLGKEAFAVLLSMLVSQDKLNATAIAQAVDDVTVGTKVGVVSRFDTWGTEHPLTGKVGALRRAADGSPIYIKDVAGLIEALRSFAVNHYLTCAQLLELLQLLPPDPPTGTSLTGVLVTAPSGIPATTPGEARRGSQPGRRGSVPGTSDRRGSMSNTGTTSDRSSMPGNRRSSVSGTGDAGQTPVNGSIPVPPYSYKVEVASAFWCRVVDRDQGWADVMLSLTPGQQVSLSHRLGYANVFNPARPGMSYQLRMSRPDDHQIAWRLLRMAQTAQHSCFQRFAVDGVVKAIVQGPSLWPIMRGHAAEGDNPTVVLDFEFVWPDGVKQHWAAVTIQAAWRAYQTRKQAAAAGYITLKPQSRPTSSTRRPFTAAGPRQATPSAADNPAINSSRYYTTVGGAAASRPGTSAGPHSPGPIPKWESLFGGGAAGAGSAPGSSRRSQPGLPGSSRSQAGGLLAAAAGARDSGGGNGPTAAAAAGGARAGSAVGSRLQSPSGPSGVPPGSPPSGMGGVASPGGNLRPGSPLKHAS